MIYNKENRITNFAYSLRKDLHVELRIDFLDKVYNFISINDEETKDMFEEAIMEMNFDVFKDIYDTCISIGFKNAARDIIKHINIMMNIQNPSYPGVYNVDEENLKTFAQIKLMEEK